MCVEMGLVTIKIGVAKRTRQSQALRGRRNESSGFNQSGDPQTSLRFTSKPFRTLKGDRGPESNRRKVDQRGTGRKIGRSSSMELTQPRKGSYRT
jgi:hypothetical protein